MSDLTDEIYADSRASEDDAHQAAQNSVSQSFAERRARMEAVASGTAPSASPTAPPQSPSGSSVDDILAKYGSSETSSTPAVPAPSADQKPQEPTKVFPEDNLPLGLHIVRGAALGAARLSDTASGLVKDTLSYLHGDDRFADYTPEAASNLEALLGRGDTPLERGVEDVSGQVATSVGLSFVKGLQFSSWVARSVFGNAVGAASLPTDSDTVSKSLVEAFPDNSAANNPVTRMLSTETDDSTFERLLKHTVEGSFVEAGLRGTIGKVWTSGRQYFKDKAARRAGASEVGLDVDETLAIKSDELVKARLEKTQLDATLAQGSQGVDQNIPEKAIADATSTLQGAKVGLAQRQAEQATKGSQTLQVTPEGTAQPSNVNPVGGVVTVEPGGTALLPGTPTAAPRPVAVGRDKAQIVLDQADTAYKKQFRALESASTPASKVKAQVALDDALVVRNAARREVEALTPKVPEPEVPVQTKSELIEERRRLFEELKAASDEIPTKPLPKRGSKVRTEPQPGESPKTAIRRRIDEIKAALKNNPPLEKPKPLPKPEGHVPPTEIPQVTPSRIEGIPDDILEAAERRRAIAAEKVVEAEVSLVRQFEESTASPLLLKAEAESLKSTGQLSATAAAKIDDIIARAGLNARLNTFNDGLKAARTATDKLSESEAAVVAQFDASRSTPRALKAHLKALKAEGQLSPEAEAQINDIIQTKYAHVAPEPQAKGKAPSGDQSLAVREKQSAEVLQKRLESQKPKVIVGDHLELTVEQHARVVSAFKNQDLTESIAALGDVFDVTNFDNIVASGDIKSVLEWLGKELGSNENTFRLQLERSLGDTFAAGEGLLEKTAREAGASVPAMNAALLAQFPAQDLTRTLTAYRMFELSLVKKAKDIADEINILNATKDTDITKEAQLFGLAKMVALVNDRRAGLVSDVARALHSMRQPVGLAVDIFRDQGRSLRGVQLEDFLKSGGGRANIRRMAAAMSTQDLSVAGQAKLVNALARKGTPTFGDALHSWWVSNLLSGPFTQLKNVSSTQAYMMLHNTVSEFFDAAARNAHAKAVGADAAQQQHMQKWLITTQAKAAAWWKTATLDVDARARAKEAWRIGQRITANPAGTSGVFSELGESNYARATGLAQILRGDSHFKGLKSFKGVRLLPKKFSYELADALDASATKGTKQLWRPLSSDPEVARSQKYGTAAGIIDLLGRLNSWPLHALATADELNAGIARSAALQGEAFGLAMNKGLVGNDAMAFVRDLTENMSSIDDLLRLSKEGSLDEATTLRLGDMVKASDAADDYVRRMTFTQDADPIMQKFAAAREYIPGGRWNLVFVRTPGNLLKAGVTESPFWHTGEAINSAFKGQGSDAAGAAGKAVYTSGLALTALKLAQTGHMTGSGPLNPEANEMWRKEGNKPYFLNFDIPGIGPTGFNYGSYIDPVALPMQVMAEGIEAFRYMDQGQQDHWAKEFTVRFMRLMASKSYVNAVTDWVTAAGNPRAAERMLVRVTSNFVPQSRLIAQLGTIEAAALADSYIDTSRPGEGRVMTMADYINGQKNIIDEGKGVVLDDEGKVVPRNAFGAKTMAFVISNATDPLPDDIRDWMIQTSNDLLKLRIDKGRFQDRDLFYRSRLIIPGADSEAISSVYNEQSPKNDPVSAELRRVGLDYSTRSLFGAINGVPLSPEQMDYYHQKYAHVNKDNLPVYEKYKKAIESEAYTNLGDSIVGVGKGTKYKVLFKIHSDAIDKAQYAVRSKYPAVDAALKQQQGDRKLLKTQAGSEQLKMEIEKRRYTGTQAFLEALNLGGD